MKRKPFCSPQHQTRKGNRERKENDNSDNGSLTPPLPQVGDCLSARWSQWQKIGADLWVVAVLHKGYHFPFEYSSPPHSPYPISFESHHLKSQESLPLAREVTEMIDKDALKEVLTWIWSFTVEKITGNWRPVVDMSPLNKFIQQTKFKMETTILFIAAVGKGDFLASIDLKDAYLQVSVHLMSRQFLRFVLEDRVSHFKVLCFGLSMVQLFLRALQAVLVWVHSSRIHLLRYLDNWLLLASTADLNCHISQVISLFHNLGVVIILVRALHGQHYGEMHTEEEHSLTS